MKNTKFFFYHTDYLSSALKASLGELGRSAESSVSDHRLKTRSNGTNDDTVYISLMAPRKIIMTRFLLVFQSLSPFQLARSNREVQM